MVKRKRLNEDLVLISTPHFPYNSAKHRPKRTGSNRALLGIGGNIGDTLRRFEHLFWYLRRSPMVSIVETSPMLQNPPFGYAKQEDFLNALILVETPLQPQALLRYLLQVEKHFGRKRSFKNAPRTLDIDMIFYENVTMDTPRLQLPHPGYKERVSVLIPLSKMKERI